MSRTDNEFNRAANDSPRSGSAKRMAPVVWCIIVAIVVVLAAYFATRA